MLDIEDPWILALVGYLFAIYLPSTNIPLHSKHYRYMNNNYLGSGDIGSETLTDVTVTPVSAQIRFNFPLIGKVRFYQIQLAAADVPNTDIYAQVVMYKEGTKVRGA